MPAVICDRELGPFRVIAVSFSEGEVRALLPEAREWLRSYLELIEADGDDLDFYVGTAEEVAIGELLARALREHLGFPLLDCEAHEEPGYGLPGFSVYLNEDARSWCGRWWYDGLPPEAATVCYGLPGREEDFERVGRFIRELAGKDGGERLAVAVLLKGMAEDCQPAS